jgi:hypothetical protein
MSEYVGTGYKFDPAGCVAAPAYRRLLVQHGRDDGAAPISEGRHMFEAAAEPKQGGSTIATTVSTTSRRLGATALPFFRPALAAQS